MLRSKELLFDLVRNLFLPFTASIALPLLFIDPALADRKLAEQQLASRPEPTTVLELSRSQRRVRVLSDNQEIAAFPVAVGRASSPTPLGEHTIFRMQKDPVWLSPLQKER